MGEVTQPLTPIVDGRSTTTVDATLDDIVAGRRGTSINIHRSEAEANIYTACIEIRSIAAARAAPAATPTPVTVTAPPRTGSGGQADVSAANVVKWLLAFGGVAAIAGAVGLTLRRAR